MSARAGIICGDVLDVLPTLESESVHCVVTSPPYFGLRDYGVPPTDWPAVSYAPMPGLPHIEVPAMSCCLGLETDIAAFIGHLVTVLREVWRVLRKDGTCWLNMGDSYAGNGAAYDDRSSTLQGSKQSGRMGATRARKMGLPAKQLFAVPWRLALALQADGWWLRSDIIWSKPGVMPESVKDRPTRAHEYVFLLTKSARYYYDYEAIKEPIALCTAQDRVDTGRFRKDRGYPGYQHSAGSGRLGSADTRNKRSVWTIPTHPFKQAHFATFPPRLVETCLKAGCPIGGTGLDPFAGSGTTGLVAAKLGRLFIGIERSSQYAAMAERRIHDNAGLLALAEG